MGERIKSEIGQLDPGRVFKYGGLRWCKLDNVHGGSLCCAVLPLFWRPFGWDNDWYYSKPRKNLNKDLLNAIIKHGGKLDAFIVIKSDLLSADGLDDYGIVDDTLSILSDNMYQTYRGVLPPTDRPFWTLTPHSTIPPNNTLCHYVTKQGDIDKIPSNWPMIYVRPVSLLANKTIIIIE